jgi:8-oxo-dGTP pyrophosphatase MutT (NUDIX family)
MSPYQVCVCFITRLSDDGVRQVLLGRKKTGLGSGNIVGMGGKIEEGETPLQAIVREIEEESSLVVRPSDVRQLGFIPFSRELEPGLDGLRRRRLQRNAPGIRRAGARLVRRNRTAARRHVG